MNLPNRGDIIVFTDNHPRYSDKAGEVFGIVIKTNGYIVVVECSEGDTDRILWCNTNGDANPFYASVGRLSDVMVNTGKHKGRKGVFICWTDKNKLSSERRAQLRIQTGLGWVTILVNENNFKFITRTA